jgi:hypothetical protein
VDAHRQCARQIGGGRWPVFSEARQDGGFGQGKLLRGGRRAHAAHQ